MGILDKEQKQQAIQLTKEEIHTNQLSELSAALHNAEKQIRLYVIDQPELVGEKAIKSQENLYSEMLRNAEAGLYDEETNNAIITKNKAVRDEIAEITLIVNRAKSIIVSGLNNGKDMKSMIDALSNTKVTKKSLTKTQMTKYKKQFGI